ncbi:MAG: Tad domain-containing protein, partial [Planctomycetales bacterium]|nr:Tad domain-containing protein [Planctomycetales bacterium]
MFFAMMLFGIMALAALVIDIGFARLTQRQMQTAADSAAIEGLRSAGGGQTEARQVVEWHFDDDLSSTGSYPADDDGAFDTGSGQFGAGPAVAFSGGAGDLSLVASQLMEIDPNNPVHKPQVLDGPSSATGSFQVALRRGPTDIPIDAHLYANGPAVPYLFARGSLINRQLIANGITVRGTATAEFRAAKSVGFAIGPDVPGLTSFALPTDGV